MSGPNIKIGIIGGGQLAEMSMRASKDLGINVYCLCASETDPAYKNFPSDCFMEKDLEAFAKAIDVVGFESEFFNETLLEKIIQYNPLVATSPKTSSILKLRNKLEQKMLFKQAEIPQADFIKLIPQYFSTTQSLGKLFEKFSNGFVLKWAIGGYDGKGNFVLKKNCSEDRRHEALDFCTTAFNKRVDVYAEELIDFKLELALMSFFTDRDDNQHFYPLVISQQEDNICKEVWGPAQKFGVVEQIEALAQRAARKIQNAYPDLRVFGVEFFLDTSGKLLVNEMAPRVHNSGHYSQLFPGVSQFHNWLKCMTKQSFQTFDNGSLFLMRNFIGGANSFREPTPEETSGEKELYWYGKTPIKPGRKMGHANVLLSSVDDLTNKRAALKMQEQVFWDKLKLQDLKG